MFKEHLDSNTVYIFTHNDGRKFQGTFKDAIQFYGSLAFACQNVCWKMAGMQSAEYIEDVLCHDYTTKPEDWDHNKQDMSTSARLQRLECLMVLLIRRLECQTH